MAERASWRADGRYRPVDRIDLVLLGDVLDIIRSGRWLQGSVRPWDDVQAPDFIETVNSITTGILKNNVQALGVLRSLSSAGSIRVPHASRAGQPLQAAENHPVPVQIHYMVGNHDWPLHLSGASYNLLRRQVVEQLGLANRPDMPLPHDPAESDQLLEVMRRHRVLARHGDIFDPLNFEEDRDASSLGDVIVVELVNRFAIQVGRELGDQLPPAVLAGLKEIDNIRPLLLIPVWIEGLLERNCTPPALRKALKRIWDGLADELLALRPVRQRDSWSPFDLVDGLERALKFSKRLSIGWASRIMSWLNDLNGGSSDSYYRHALAEQDFRNRRARQIVSGHTHRAESVPLDASYADGYVLNQMYFNSGTWRRVHRRTRLAVGEHEFISSECMTYLAFFQGDERAGRSYESWSGMLGISSADGISHRIDAGQSSHAALQSVPASDVPVRAPHFATPSRQPESTPVRDI